MGWHIGGTFCECVECERQFMGPSDAALYNHMIRDHGLNSDMARQRTAESKQHHVTEEYFYIPGIG